MPSVIHLWTGGPRTLFPPALRKRFRESKNRLRRKLPSLFPFCFIEEKKTTTFWFPRMHRIIRASANFCSGSKLDRITNWTIEMRLGKIQPCPMGCTWLPVEEIIAGWCLPARPPLPYIYALLGGVVSEVARHWPPLRLERFDQKLSDSDWRWAKIASQADPFSLYHSRGMQRAASQEPACCMLSFLHRRMPTEPGLSLAQ